MSDSDDTILVKINALYHVNKEIIERIQAKLDQPNNGKVIRGRQLQLSPGSGLEDWLALRVEETTASAKQIVGQWRPKIEPKFHSTEEMNMFNDHLDYQVQSFKDLFVLNDTLPKVAGKFGFLDRKKSPPILRLFLNNLEVIQTLLGSIEHDLQDVTHDGIAELQEEAEQLIRKATALARKVSKWNRSHQPETPRLSLKLVPSCDGRLSNEGTKFAAAPSESYLFEQYPAAYSELPLTNGAPVRLRIVTPEIPRLAGDRSPPRVDENNNFDWFFLGVHSNPTNAPSAKTGELFGLYSYQCWRCPEAFGWEVQGRSCQTYCGSVRTGYHTLTGRDHTILVTLTEGPDATTLNMTNDEVTHSLTLPTPPLGAKASWHLLLSINIHTPCCYFIE